MKINCDIGERGANQTDIELIKLIDIANIACGGHAGDADTVKLFRDLAAKYNVEVSAHLSYPDRKNFGRVSMDIDSSVLKDSLTLQYSLLSDIKTVKLHGALYNDCWFDEELSRTVVSWFIESGISSVIAPDNSVLAAYCREYGIDVIREAFAERRYNFDTESRQLSLVSRKHPRASIDNCQQAIEQYEEIRSGSVTAFTDSSQRTCIQKIFTDTVCIHSDSQIALQLARCLKDV